MFDRKRARLARLGLTVAVLGATLSAALFSLTSAASAASTLGPILDPFATPESLTGCSGSLASDKSLGTDWYDYQFRCAPAFLLSGYTGNVLAFSFVVGRAALDGHNLAANNSPAVFAPGTNPKKPAVGASVLSNETVVCTVGGLSDGFNCSGGAVKSGTNLGYVPAGDLVEGAFELTAPYCKHLPSKKPGTLAVPRAVVDVIVTDASGAEDGPFELRLTKPCRAVPSIAPAKKVVTKQS